MSATSAGLVVIADEDLDDVLGGDSSTTTVRGPGVSYSSSQTDYQTCVSTVTQLTREQYPPRRFLGIFGRDRNAGPRAEATLRNLRETCGTPPS